MGSTLGCSGSIGLGTETVQGTTGALEGVDDVEGSNSLAAGGKQVSGNGTIVGRTGTYRLACSVYVT